MPEGPQILPTIRYILIFSGQTHEQTIFSHILEAKASFIGITQDHKTTAMAAEELTMSFGSFHF